MAMLVHRHPWRAIAAVAGVLGAGVVAYAMTSTPNAAGHDDAVVVAAQTATLDCPSQLRRATFVDHDGRTPGTPTAEAAVEHLFSAGSVAPSLGAVAPEVVVRSADSAEFALRAADGRIIGDVLLAHDDVLGWRITKITQCAG